MLVFQSLVALFSIFVLAPDLLVLRQSCGESYEICAPPDATSSHLPPVGPELSKLYPDMIQIINSESITGVASTRDVVLQLKQAAENTFCCARTSQCLLLPTYGIPFCWDRFTTNYYFPDGSYGSIVAGNYTSSSGVQVNLIYGNWQGPDGTSGNIYSNIPTMMPITSTLPMPTPWTSSGVGSAIPASELGSSVTVSETTEANMTTTISAITLESTTISIGTSACHHCNNTIFPGLTGLPPVSTPISSGTGLPATTTTRNGTVIPLTSGNIIPATILNGVRPTMAISSAFVLAFALRIVTYMLSII